MAVRPGAEPYRADGDGPAVLLCHGFTGSPGSMRPWAEHHAARGAAVRLPLLPGHGTTWKDMQRTRWPQWYDSVHQELIDLTETHGPAVVCGLSMGGGLALRLAEDRPDLVRGLVLVNPSVRQDKAFMSVAPLLQYVVPSVKGITNDIALQGADEVGYDRVPLRAFTSLRRFWTEVQSELARVTAPILLFRSAVDHVVAPSNSALVLARVRSAQVEERLLSRSYHVATLDHDAPEIFDGSWAFVQSLAQAGSPS